MHACLSCFSVFKPEIAAQIAKESVGGSVEGEEQPHAIPCPTADCLGQVIELDELILPAIFILNFKGYLTRNCCSGHVQSRIAETYVMFDANVDLPDMPHEFHMDELDALDAPHALVGDTGSVPNYPTIRKLHYSGDRVGSILLANKKLYEWARGLPDLNEEYNEQTTEIERRQNELRVMRMLAMGFSPYKQNIAPLMKKRAKQGPV
ncbi:hypothetical protein [Alicyclobacillus ferrooxydans]|uniref:Uncharacterized protein n=1 Tax=Alicyclobacillus ferrooxydans TaxID=471514 RepID=A0A0N8PPR7_9BACL|nr:hypothetical protein [Alicyclobacillus ferrooxydans]KPV45077.1 hypothetical protein AN477_03515 [Alicyclobacillus ferrooxydans]